MSLSAPPIEEVRVGLQILESLNLRERGLEIVSCPSCGRTLFDLQEVTAQISERTVRRNSGAILAQFCAILRNSAQLSLTPYSLTQGALRALGAAEDADRHRRLRLGRAEGRAAAARAGFLQCRHERESVKPDLQ